jgi:CheY-like chemotaxis protein/LmbE family N-acetylglucosaminyl deacetylase
MDLPSNPDHPRKRILLVEDDVDQAHLVKFLLEENGALGVTLAQDGLSAVRLLEERDWELLITDINLPGADGVEVVEASRRLRPDLPILATTGYTGPEYGARARDRGADAVLIKPLDRDDLLHHVHVLLAGKRAEVVGGPEPTLERGADDPRSPAGSERDVLVLSVRPGDAEVGCGGTLLAHSRGGDRVVLLHLSGGPHATEAVEESERHRETIKAAGIGLGARTFIATADGSGEEALLELGRLVSGAIGELRPDILYLPTVHHHLPRHRAVNHAGCEAGTDVPTILAYDPGDATPAFAPEFFVPLPETRLREKLEITAGYEPWGFDHLQPAAIRSASSFWARFAGGTPAEGLEVLKGTPEGPSYSPVEGEPRVGSPEAE